MVGNARSLNDLSRKGADLVIACRSCGHDRSAAIETIIAVFHRRAWSTDWSQAHERFRCRKCGSKDVRLDADFYGHALRRQSRPGSLVAVPDTLKPGLRPPPPGVSVADWNRATERERRKMVEKARS